MSEEQNEKQIDIIESKEEKAKNRALLCNPYQKNHVIDAGLKQWDVLMKDNRQLKKNDPLYAMLSLYEFESSWLIMSGFEEEYKVLAVDLSKQIQAEYFCSTPSEKATAHLAAQNYVRTLQIQTKIKLLLNRDSFTDMSTRRLAVLEKSYDRACKQFAQSMYSLKTLRQLPLTVNVKADTANIAQQQMIQETKNVNPK